MAAVRTLYRCPACGRYSQDVRVGLGKCESAPANVIQHHQSPYGHVPPPPPTPSLEERVTVVRPCFDCLAAREHWLWRQS